MVGSSKVWRLWWVLGVFAAFGMSPAYAQTYETEAFAQGRPAEEEDVPRSCADECFQEKPRAEHMRDNSKSFRRQHRFSLMVDPLVMVLMGTFDGVSAALPLSFRYHLPILHHGFLSSKNDWVALEVGVDSFIPFGGLINNPLLIFIPIEFFWGFQLTPGFALYWKLGIGFWFSHSYISDKFGNHDVSEFYFLPYPLPTLQLGLMWNPAKIFHIRLEIGFPGVLRFGMGFGF